MYKLILLNLSVVRTLKRTSKCFVLSDLKTILPTQFLGVIKIYQRTKFRISRRKQ